MCSLSAAMQLGSATEDVMLKIHMRTLKMLVDEVSALRERITMRDVSVDEMQLQLDFLIERDMDSL